MSTNRSATIASMQVLLVIALAVGTTIAEAAETLSYFCQASVKQSQVFYVTGTFTATATVNDVTKAWKNHIAAKDPKAKATALCQGGVDVPSLEQLRKLTTDSMTDSKVTVVNINWTFASSAAASHVDQRGVVESVCKRSPSPVWRCRICRLEID